MGYGGNLIWTSVIKTLHERDGRPLGLVKVPGFSDLIVGWLYDRTTSLETDEIFRNNPRVVFPPIRAKARLLRILDSLFFRALGLLKMRNAYERFVFLRSEKVAGRGALRLLHIDMRMHSYAKRQTAKRMIWKAQARAADAVLANFGLGPASEDCELYLTDAEYAAADALIVSERISCDFVIVEPDTNRDYFGELRAWPRDRWVAFVRKMRAAHPALAFVQIGIPGGEPLPDIVDLRGKTDFRTACVLLKRSRLFVGTEGGLTHAANAVNAKALVLWGGLTMPEFAGYPSRQRTICKRVACAPCGQLGWCHNGHICMQQISVEEVVVAANELLAAPH
jgi:hypothetical protein